MDELARFHTARRHYREYLKAQRELRWRTERALKPKDKTRKAVERLGGVGKFQSRADECACNWAADHGGFPGLASPTDAFYGQSQLVETRIDHWRGCAKLSMLDFDILAELGRHALAFMQATRTLPFFQKSWNTRAEQKWIFHSSPLNPVEAKFRKNYVTCVTLFTRLPLVPENLREVMLCLRRKLPGEVAQNVVRFLCTQGRFARS